MNVTTPVFSIISAVYNVAEYLPRYLESLSSQTIDHGKLEVILVIDGSLDDSERIIRAWAVDSDIETQIVVKENGGQASARNRGLSVARGEWLTFCDPDDFVANDYFEHLDQFIASHGKLSIVATRLVSFHEEVNEFRHDHPLEKRFRLGSRVVELNSQPNFFHMHGPTAVVRRANVLKFELEFNEKLQFSFEDAHFVASYILHLTNPNLGYCVDAEYFYRKRSSGDSSVQTSKHRPEKYTKVLVDGHLDLIHQALNKATRVPDWLQQMLIYDILWYFRGDRRVGAASRSLQTHVKKEFHENISLILEHISVANIHSFDAVSTDWDLRYALTLGYKDHNYGVPKVSAMEIDAARSLTQLRYVYRTELPEETVIYKGQVRRPNLVSSRAVKFFDRVMFHHRFVWVPARGRLSIELDGAPAAIEIKGPSREKFELRPYATSVQLLGYDLFSGSDAKQAPVVDLEKISHDGRSESGEEHAYRFFTRLAKRKSKHNVSDRQLNVSDSEIISDVNVEVLDVNRANKYKDAWVLMDRPERANDNAEQLYREILNNHIHINAWFVLDKGSPDWNRLESEGFRMIPYGGAEYYSALIRSEVFASSHMDRYISDPLPDSLKKYKRWKFVFLQHGITKDDLSSWFNSKDISLIVTSTHDEYRSIVDTDSNYRFGAKEVELTGFPRHDRLLENHFTKPEFILVSPTWRDWLFTIDPSDGSRAVVSDLSSTDFAMSWRAVLCSEKLNNLATAHGLQIALLPHPFLEPYLEQLNLPPHIRVLGWEEMTFAEVVAKSSMMITDYSSTAFEAAYVGKPVVYFQFDEELVRNGAHTYERGYFDYDRDGFGPCVRSSQEVISRVCDVIKFGEDIVYLRRKHRTFKYRDTNNSLRVVKAIQKRIQVEGVGRVLK